LRDQLSSLQYDAVIPVPEEHSIAELTLVSGQEDAYAHKIAQQVASDTYITYSVTSEDAGFGAQRVAIQVHAYATTTGRLLGTETGYSEGHRDDQVASIGESMRNAIDKVLHPINNYWINAGR